MKRLGWGTVAGIGVAGLLVAGIPAHAQSGSSAGSTTSGQSTDDRMGGSTSSQAGSTTGSGSTSPQSGSTMGTGSSSTTSDMGTGSSGTASDTSGMKSKNELTGKVEKFDRDTKELTLANSDKKLKVSDSTRVMKDGQRASLSDIKEGDQVRASFSGTGDTLQVNRIDVMTSGSMGTGMGTGTGTTTTPPADTGTGTTTAPPSDTGTGTTKPPSDTGTGTTGSGSSGATPPPSKGY